MSSVRKSPLSARRRCTPNSLQEDTSSPRMTGVKGKSRKEPKRKTSIEKQQKPNTQDDDKMVGDYQVTIGNKRKASLQQRNTSPTRGAKRSTAIRDEENETGTDSGTHSVSTSTELQPCPVPSKKAVATVLPVGDDRVQQHKENTNNKEIYHVLMTLKDCIERFYMAHTGNSGQVSPGDGGVSSQGMFSEVDSCRWLDYKKKYKKSLKELE